jgi:diguanylate cyclase (GGDEF)-like protein
MVADIVRGGPDRYEGPAANRHSISHTTGNAPIPVGNASELCVERSAGSSTSRALSTVALLRRMLIGVCVALGGFGLSYRAATEFGGLDQLMALAPATLVALVVAAISMPRAVSPLVAVQADLQVRYEAAVADALHDQLTGLGNHRAFHEELDRQVDRALADETPIGLLLIDLDEFKQMNDTRGHAAGDSVLRGFGRLLTATLRRTDRAYRVGGDEFAVVMPATDLEGARMMGRRLLAQALQPALHHDELQPVSFSGGISCIPELADGRARLYSQADSALYAAKRGGRTDVVAYDGSVEVLGDAETRSSLTAAVAEVIARGQLAAVYQPIVALASGRVLGVEGLIRPVPPAPFADASAMFEAAEAGGRVTALDLACLERVVAGARGLPSDLFLSVNISPTTIEAPEFSSTTLLGILGRHGFSPDRVVVELTERQALHDPGRVRDRIDACRRAGIRFAADDIGAGNAGLQLLAEISFDILKVDLGLVQRSATDGQSGAVLGSVVDLATRMGALLVAEGIEHASQLPSLSALGIQAGQGHHLGRPGAIEDAVPIVEVEALGISAWRQSIGLPSAS